MRTKKHQVNLAKEKKAEKAKAATEARVTYLEKKQTIRRQRKYTYSELMDQYEDRATAKQNKRTK